MGLDTYRSRRDFRRTPEPSGARRRRGGSRATKTKKTGNPVFVIQLHDARTRHFDFRLEVDGALRSWAVPKGPSTDPREKRLAVETEDHPLDYADFEGVIPEGEYGAGSVIVWDAGPYRCLSADEDGNDLPIAAALDRGRAEVWLEGKKTRGGYALVRAKLRGEKKNWLLVKMKDEGADARRNPVKTETKSVLSGRSVEDVAREAKGRAGSTGRG